MSIAFITVSSHPSPSSPSPSNNCYLFSRWLALQLVKFTRVYLQRQTHADPTQCRHDAFLLGAIAYSVTLKIRTGTCTNRAYRLHERGTRHIIGLTLVRADYANKRLPPPLIPNQHRRSSIGSAVAANSKAIWRSIAVSRGESQLVLTRTCTTDDLNVAAFSYCSKG